jgi:hypothetical protein
LVRHWTQIPTPPSTPSHIGVVGVPLHWAAEVHPATQRSVVVLQAAAASPQSAFPVHCTQRPNVVLHAGVVPEQLVLDVHCTQRFVVVLQWGVVPPHVVSSTHWTQRLVVVLQAVAPPPPPAQFAFVRHWTQAPVAVLQWAVGAAQFALDVQAVAHVLFVQTPASPQSAFVTQATQVPVDVSQWDLAPVPQFVSLRHWTQAFVLVLQ